MNFKNNDDHILTVAYCIENIGTIIEREVKTAMRFLHDLDNRESGVSDIVARAMAYWVAAIMSNIGNEDFGQGSMVTLNKTVEELHTESKKRKNT